MLLKEQLDYFVAAPHDGIRQSTAAHAVLPGLIDMPTLRLCLQHGRKVERSQAVPLEEQLNDLIAALLDGLQQSAAAHAVLADLTFMPMLM